MPLSKRARIEVYLPDRNDGAYIRLESAIKTEFLHTFGGCTVITDIQGFYRASNNLTESDRINLIYADTTFDLDANFGPLSLYADDLREWVIEGSDEESVLVVVHEIYHSV